MIPTFVVEGWKAGFLGKTWMSKDSSGRGFPSSVYETTRRSRRFCSAEGAVKAMGSRCSAPISTVNSASPLAISVLPSRSITRQDAACEDEIGGWPRDPAPGCAPAATRLEGLCAAHRLLRLVGRPTDWLAPSIRAAARFLLRLQFREDNAHVLKNPGRAYGGFAHSVLRPDIRIDYVQHAAAALLAASDILEAEAEDAR